jgi:hypothetical protein
MPIFRSRIMDHGDIIRKHLTGTSGEQSRREELVQALIDAFSRAGSEAVAAELEGRIDALEEAFDEKLQALNDILS